MIISNYGSVASVFGRKQEGKTSMRIYITKEENMFCENDTIHWRDILLSSTIHPEEYFDDPRKASM